MLKIKEKRGLGLLFMLFTLVACNNAPKEQEKVSKELENNWVSLFKENYTINFPKAWAIDTTGANNTRFVLISQRIDSFDNFSENINLVTQEIGNTSLAEYVQFSAKEIQGFMQDAKIMQSKDFYKGAVKYHKTVFKATNEGVPFIFEQYYVVQSQMAYILTYSAEASSYENMQPIVNEVMSSFEVFNLK